MAVDRLIPSPACQLTPKAVRAVDQASIEDIIEPGAFSEMGHLPAAQVLADSLGYAEQLLDGLSSGASKALKPGLTPISLLSLGLLHADAMFVSQVIALQDLCTANAVNADKEATSGPTLAELMDAARRHFVDRCDAWAKEPGRRSDAFRVQKGDLDYLYPSAVALMTSSSITPGSRSDDFALFVAMPLLAPFLVREEDCFIAPRLE